MYSKGTESSSRFSDLGPVHYQGPNWESPENTVPPDLCELLKIERRDGGIGGFTPELKVDYSVTIIRPPNIREDR
jgi:hypothetical protein